MICRWQYVIPLALCWCLAQAAFAQSAAPWVGETFDGIPCRGRESGFGPFDYLLRSSLSYEINIVEGAHFTPKVEQLISGSRGSLLGDLDYTLRAWPNHHRALNSMKRYQHRVTRNEPSAFQSGEVPPAECYLNRAINFSPADATAWMLLGMHAHRRHEFTIAMDAYQAALELDPENVQIKYNYALLLVERGERDRAQELANEVYAVGFPLLGLKKKLSSSDPSIQRDQPN